MPRTEQKLCVVLLGNLGTHLVARGALYPVESKYCTNEKQQNLHSWP